MSQVLYRISHEKCYYNKQSGEKWWDDIEQLMEERKDSQR
jgi:hypothetical protein